MSTSSTEELVRSPVQGVGATPATRAEQPGSAPPPARTPKTTTYTINGQTVTVTEGGDGRTVIVGDRSVVPPVPPSVLGWPAHDEVPPQVVDISLGFFAMIAIVAIGWPLARAFGRRIERRAGSSALPANAAEQLQRIEQAVDAMAIEVERISESQRFMARLQVGDGGRLPTPERQEESGKRSE